MELDRCPSSRHAGSHRGRTVARKRITVRYLSCPEQLTAMGQRSPHWTTTLIGALSGLEARQVAGALWRGGHGDAGIAVGVLRPRAALRPTPMRFGRLHSAVRQPNQQGAAQLGRAHNLCNTWRHAIEFPTHDPRQADQVRLRFRRGRGARRRGGGMVA